MLPHSVFMLLGAHFWEALETFRASEGIFSSAVSKNGEAYSPAGPGCSNAR